MRVVCQQSKSTILYVPLYHSPLSHFIGFEYFVPKFSLTDINYLVYSTTFTVYIGYFLEYFNYIHLLVFSFPPLYSSDLIEDDTIDEFTIYFFFLFVCHICMLNRDLLLPDFGLYQVWSTRIPVQYGKSHPSSRLPMTKYVFIQKKLVHVPNKSGV